MADRAARRRRAAARPRLSRIALRRLFGETPQTVENAAVRVAYERAYEVHDWEPVNELTFSGRPYRIIRAQPFIRMERSRPGPPMPTRTRRARRSGPRRRWTASSSTRPRAPGLTDALVRMELVSAS
nr:DUF5954 family protein [Micromonospora sp. AMSO12t]